MDETYEGKDKIYWLMALAKSATANSLSAFQFMAPSRCNGLLREW